MKQTARHQEVFEAWYSANRNFRKTAESCSVSERSLYAWAERFDWHERADARDHAAQKIVDEKAAKERADRQIKRRKSGELLAARGREFLTNFKIDSARDAIQAIKIGTEIERKEDGIPDWVLMILNANDGDLEAMAKALGVSVSSGDAEGGDADSFSLESDAEEDE